MNAAVAVVDDDDDVICLFDDEFVGIVDEALRTSAWAGRLVWSEWNNSDIWA